MSYAPRKKENALAKAPAAEAPTTGSPFNLSDVVPFRPVPEKSATTSEKARSALRWQERVGSLDRVVGVAEDITWEEKKAIDGMKERWNRRSEEASLSVLSAEGHLPEGLTPPAKVARLAALPTVELAELRRVVDVLDMVIMPFAYLKFSAYEKEKWELRAAIEAFAAETPAAFSVYVAAPVQYYDVPRHVAAEEDLPIFAGRHVAPAFLAMGMALPMFRAITRDLKAIRDRTNSHSERLRQAEEQIIQLDTRINQLQATVERQQAELIQQNLRAAAREEELRAAEARTSFMAYEPMMLAIPKGRSVLDPGHALVGPCWGPDFEAIVMTALGLRKYDGQRAALAAATAPFAPRNRW